MDASKVDLVMQYALAAAAREDDPWSRRLGRIQLIKYVYLADLAYAGRHDGETFTGAPWRFFRFGPWAEAVADRIPEVVHALSAAEHRFPSAFSEEDVVRWSIDGPEEAERLLNSADRVLPAEVTGFVRKAVRDFGNDTPGLLHFVYATPPMTRAAPNEPLNFSGLVPLPKREATSPDGLSAKALKRRKEALKEIQAKVQAKLAEKRNKRSQQKSVGPPPRYDEVFAQGTRWLDEQGEVPDLKGEVHFPDDIWKDPWRKPDDS